MSIRNDISNEKTFLKYKEIKVTLLLKLFKLFNKRIGDLKIKEIPLNCTLVQFLIPSVSYIASLLWYSVTAA